MSFEMMSLYKNDVWILVEPPEGRKIVGSKWVYNVKKDADGNVERYKARVVARGFIQKIGEDYDENFSPVVRLDSCRALTGLAAKHSYKLPQMDVTTAFLYGALEKNVYMKQPDRFIQKGRGKVVCKLNCSLYKLKQSPKCWNTVLDE